MAHLYLLISFTQMYAGALRDIGSAKITMYILLFSYVAFRQAYLMVAHLLGHTLPAITMGYPAGWMMATLLLSIFYRRSELCAGKRAKAQET